MILKNKLYLLFTFLLLFPSKYPLAQQKVLRLATHQSIKMHAQYYCHLFHTFGAMGYKLIIEHVPLIRGDIEANKGNYPLVDIFKFSFQTKSIYKGEPDGIEVSKFPYTSGPINYYALKKSEVVIDITHPLTSYQIGVLRNPYSHYQRNESKLNHNYSYYSSLLSAFKALNLKRIDIVITALNDYRMIKPQINKNNEITLIMSSGTIFRYIGFSNKFFGKDNAKKLVQQYDKEMTQFLQDPSINCTDIYPTYSPS